MFGFEEFARSRPGNSVQDWSRQDIGTGFTANLREKTDNLN
ncbi:hypothetical protein [Coleofasciculus sp. G2-EDA-02]